jgi:hypothetical protein
MPAAKTILRPNRSATEPAVSSSAAKLSAYASITHCRSDNEACNCRWISGSATLTIVISSNSMNTPSTTATRVHHFVCISFS